MKGVPKINMAKGRFANSILTIQSGKSSVLARNKKEICDRICANGSYLPATVSFLSISWTLSLEVGPGRSR